MEVNDKKDIIISGNERILVRNRSIPTPIPSPIIPSALPDMRSDPDGKLSPRYPTILAFRLVWDPNLVLSKVNG